MSNRRLQYDGRIFLLNPCTMTFGSFLLSLHTMLNMLKIIFSLDRMPPVPTLQTGPNPLHTFTGFPSNQHILSLSLRDPFDGREMPANNKQFVSAYCIRGVRKASSISIMCTNHTRKTNTITYFFPTLRLHQLTGRHMLSHANLI